MSFQSLMDEIQAAQIRAAEDVVIRDLERMGLSEPAAPEQPIAMLERDPARGILRIEYTDEITNLPPGKYALYAVRVIK